MAKLSRNAPRVIATRLGRPAYENPPPRQRGDMAEWKSRLGRPREPGFLRRLFGRA